MVKFDVEGSQNVEVSKKIKCEKPLLRQMEIMEQYTETHKRFSGASKERQEVECLKVLFPQMFRSIEDADLIAGRLDFLPIGFGTVTSVGGVGHYCVFAKLRAFQKEAEAVDASCHDRVEKLYEYWLDHDLKTEYCRRVLTETTIGRFIDVNYPLIATARLSGMMLDYPKLLDNGISDLKRIIEKKKLASQPDNEFYITSLECLDILTARAELQRMADVLGKIRTDRPETFAEALQLFWLYALLVGVINYGRLDDFLGPYLAADLNAGRLTEQEAYDYHRSVWTMIENRRTTVNGRIIVGGKGRNHPEEADASARIALRVCKDCRYVEPQFTLRIENDTPEDIWQAALVAIGAGATYPTLYNDEVNVPAVGYGMRVD